MPNVYSIDHIDGTRHGETQLRRLLKILYQEELPNLFWNILGKMVKDIVQVLLTEKVIKKRIGIRGSKSVKKSQKMHF